MWLIDGGGSEPVCIELSRQEDLTKWDEATEGAKQRKKTAEKVR
jgi:hypothetical protein